MLIALFALKVFIAAFFLTVGVGYSLLAPYLALGAYRLDCDAWIRLSLLRDAAAFFLFGLFGFAISVLAICRLIA